MDDFNQSCLRWGLCAQVMTRGLESASYMLRHVMMWLGGSSNGSQGLLKHHQLQTQQLSFFQPCWV